MIGYLARTNYWLVAFRRLIFTSRSNLLYLGESLNEVDERKWWDEMRSMGPDGARWKQLDTKLLVPGRKVDVYRSPRIFSRWLPSL